MAVLSKVSKLPNFRAYVNGNIQLFFVGIIIIIIIIIIISIIIINIIIHTTSLLFRHSYTQTKSPKSKYIHNPHPHLAPPAPLPKIACRPAASRSPAWGAVDPFSPSCAPRIPRRRRLPFWHPSPPPLLSTPRRCLLPPCASE